MPAARPMGCRCRRPELRVRAAQFRQPLSPSRFRGGALAVYLDGQPVVDVWTGWSDAGVGGTGRPTPRRWCSRRPRGLHGHPPAGRPRPDRLRRPVAEYWREFGANGKADITVREVMRHRAGLSHLNVACGSANCSTTSTWRSGSRPPCRPALRQVGLPRDYLRLAVVRPGPGHRQGHA